MTTPTFFTGLEAEATICARCGYCRSVCPTYSVLSWESNSPRGRVALMRALHDGLALSPPQAERVYQCTLCSHCTQVCPVGIDLRQFWLAARTELAGRDLAPARTRQLRDTLAQHGNIYAYPDDERAAWVEYLDDPPDDLYRGRQAEVVYFVGCVSSFSPGVQRIPRAFVQVLEAAGVEFTLLADERCCGFPLQAAGMASATEKLRLHNLTQLQASGAHTVVFTCPACRLAWREAYARYVPDIELLHATEFIARLLKLGRLNPGERLRCAQHDMVVTYHDPCDLARNGQVFEEPRQILSAIPGLRLVEIIQNREHGLCCGGGGDLEMVAPEQVAQIAAHTVGRFAATGAEAIITACQQCVRTLETGVEESGVAIQVMDIVEMVANDFKGQTSHVHS